MKVSAIAVLVNTTVNGISLSMTPPANEIYEAVLRNKFESRDNMEKILLEISDLESSIESTDSTQSDIISKLKEDLQTLQAAHENSLDGMDSFKDQKDELKFKLDEIKSSYGDQLKNISVSVEAQANGIDEMHSELFSRMNQLEVEFHTEIEKTRNRENEILSRIDRMTKTSDEFMKSTNSRLFELTELENRSNSVLEEINSSNIENAKKIDFIEEFEATTNQKISGQESEIRILSKMLNSLQNKLSIDEFKEERLAEKLKLTSLETMGKIDSLRDEIEFLKEQQPEEHIVDEIALLENELTDMEFEVFMQHMRMDGISKNNKKHVTELKETDYKLEDKLESVKDTINKIGTTVLVAQRKMIDFKH